MFARSHLLAQIGPGTLRVCDAAGTKPVVALEATFRDADELRSALVGLSAPIRRHRLPRRILVAVQPPLLQRRTLTDLPPVRPTELAHLVSRTPQRYFRQNGHPLVSAAQWELVGDPPRKVARAVALESDLAAAIVEGVRRAGLTLQDIVPDGGPASLSLLPTVERSRRRLEEWQELLRLGATVFLLWVAVGVFVTIRFKVESGRLQSELVRLKEPREALVRAGEALSNASAMLVAIDQSDSSRNQLVGRLEHLIRSLPDSVVLSSLTLDTGKTALVSGRARQLARFMATLEQSSSRRVRLEGQTNRDTLSGIEWERFSLRLQQGERP